MTKLRIFNTKPRRVLIGTRPEFAEMLRRFRVEGDQNEWVLFVKNWDPYGRALRNLRPANTLRPAEKICAVQNSKNTESHTQVDSYISIKRSKHPSDVACGLSK